MLGCSTFVVVLATVTDDSQHLLGPRELDLLPEGARLVLVSRAAATLEEICADDEADLARMSVGLRVVRGLLSTG